MLKETLEGVGIQVRDDTGNIRSPEDLAEDVMALLKECDEENAGRLLFMIALAKYIDEDNLID